MKRHDIHIIEFDEREFLSLFRQPDKNNMSYTTNEWTVESVTVKDYPKDLKTIVVVLRQRG